jgi:hypothetical protein
MTEFRYRIQSHARPQRSVSMSHRQLLEIVRCSIVRCAYGLRRATGEPCGSARLLPALSNHQPDPIEPGPYVQLLHCASLLAVQLSTAIRLADDDSDVSCDARGRCDAIVSSMTREAGAEALVSSIDFGCIERLVWMRWKLVYSLSFGVRSSARASIMQDGCTERLMSATQVQRRIRTVHPAVSDVRTLNPPHSQ